MSWNLKSVINQLFVQKLILANSKITSKLPITGHLWDESAIEGCIPFSNLENMSVSWHHPELHEPPVIHLWGQLDSEMPLVPAC